MRRADDAETWMEIFEGVDNPQGFPAILEAIVARSGLLQALSDKGGRHVEHFRSMPLH